VAATTSKRAFQISNQARQHPRRIRAAQIRSPWSALVLRLQVLSRQPGGSMRHAVAQQSNRKPFRWSWQLGRIAGIPVFVHATFPLLLLWVALSEVMKSGSVRAALVNSLLVLLVLFTVVLHELGHALTARRFGIATKDITLLPIGGMARLDRMPDRPWQELSVALAGPMVNVVIAVALFVVLRFADLPIAIDRQSMNGGSFVANLAWINLSLAAFNLLPAFPMDGGRVLRALMSLWMPALRATEVATSIGKMLAVMLGVLGVFSSPTLVLIALFVWFGATSELHSLHLKTHLLPVSVQRAMITQFEALPADSRLRFAVERTLASFQHDFPVMKEHRMVGILTRGKLIQGLTEYGPDALIEKVMQPTFERATVGESAHVALERLRESGGETLPVFDGEQLIGLVTPENVAELVAFDSALEAQASLTVTSTPADAV
jgi:Zn-dependent protease